MSKVIIKVFGPEEGCPRCYVALKIANKVAEKFGDKVVVKKVPIESPEADAYGIMLSPAVVVNDKVVVSGRIPTERELLEIVKNELFKEG